jgi:hypothetical protein
MWSRALAVFTLIFFIVMNVLLLRSEFGGRNEVRSTIPGDLVLGKILTAPDNSFLEVRHHGRKIGTCQLSPSVGQELATGKLMTEDLPPEGMVEELTSYTLEANGNVTLEEASRLRFNFDLKFSTNHQWQQIALRATLRPLTVEIRSTAEEKKVHFKMEDGAERTERSYTFEELQRPDKILQEFGGLLLPAAVGALGLNLQGARNPAMTLGFKWDAREDKLKVGGSFMRVYRLQTRILDHFAIVIYVSRIGEVLRIELPDEIVLANDALLNL